jgi:hypothetical protein
MFMQGGVGQEFVSGSWISDRPEAEEHPVVPIGLNEMAVPRMAIIASFGTIALLLLSIIWVGLGAFTFLDQFDGAFASVAEEDIQVDGRWTWEATLLFEGCEARDGDWPWPSDLAAQDDIFWLPGDVVCTWEHQGPGDYAHLAIHNVDDVSPLPLSIKVDHAAVSLDGQGQGLLLEIAAGDAVVIPLRLEAGLSEALFTITLSHVSLPSASISLDVDAYSDGTEKDRHARNERLNVAYTVWDADTGDQLDSGLLPATAGEDPMCSTPVPWVCYIEGFGWGLVGLDANMEESLTLSGTTHRVLLPPDLAYADRDGHVIQDRWLLFELELEQLLV